MLSSSRGGAVVARADTESERQTLKGLKGIKVIVEVLEAEVSLAGLTVASIKTDVELKLRLAGIPVDAAFDTFFYVNVNVVVAPVGYWPYSIYVELHQEVLLVRDLSISGYGITWSEGYAGMVGKANVRNVRDDVKDMVDKFINAYLSVNPK